jgi:peptidoglycan/LPS O-acetylase OafA/YrhL
MTQTLTYPRSAPEIDRTERGTRVRAGSRARRFRPDIEGMRAFAVVAVVLYHAHLGVPGGYVGVDVFFVISGFLITRQLAQSVGRQGIRALPTFYTRRIKRLLPAAALVVAATLGSTLRCCRCDRSRSTRCTPRSTG